MNQQIGPILRQARESKNLSLEQVARETHMREHYLRALEEGNFEALPSDAQARGFLRAYSDYLDLDLNYLPDPPENEPVIDPPVQEPPTKMVEIPDDREASEIFLDVGSRLRKQRELLGLSLDDVERHTHLRERYLVALESGDIDSLPSPVQGRGMLNNYATFLGLESDLLLLRFAEGLQAQLTAKQAKQPPRSSKKKRKTRPLPTPIRRLFSGDILIGGTLAILLVVFVFWGAIRIFAIQAEQVPTPTAPSIAEVLLASATPSSTATALPATPTPPPTIQFPNQAQGTDVFSGDPFPQSAEGDVQIYVTVYQRAWMKVVVDEEEQFNGRVIPGSAYAFSGAETVEIATGNGAGLNIMYNEENLGLMGSMGQVVNHIYAIDGVMTPTATITPTPTETLPASPTPTASSTPRPGEATVPPNP